MEHIRGLAHVPATRLERLACRSLTRLPAFMCYAGSEELQFRFVRIVQRVGVAGAG